MTDTFYPGDAAVTVLARDHYAITVDFNEWMEPGEYHAWQRHPRMEVGDTAWLIDPDGELEAKGEIIKANGPLVTIRVDVDKIRRIPND